MTIIYSEERTEHEPSRVPYEKWNAVKAFLNHYDNYLYLSFLAAHSKDGRERAQARKELGLCERKMEWWKRHPNYDQAAVVKGCMEAKARWLR